MRLRSVDVKSVIIILRTIIQVRKSVNHAFQIALSVQLAIIVGNASKDLV